jgi:hypothetical protein
MENNFNWITGEFEPTFKPYSAFFQDVKERQKDQNSEMSVRKYQLKQRIDGFHQNALSEAKPYLDYNAHEGGNFDLRYAENIPSVCGHQVLLFDGAESNKQYIKKVYCRKHWCSVCGGKGGHIHDARLHSLLARINPDNFNARQLVFTIPAELREIFADRDKLNDLYAMAKQVTEKHFGIPVFNKKGYVKKYTLDKPAIAYLHVFGDEELGIFKPHVNVHVLETKKIKLKLSEHELESIRLSWLKKLRKYSKSLAVVDIQYSFTTSKGKLIHKLKYMSKPWSKEHYDAIKDDNLKKLLVLSLSGFQYLRYWGQLSNRTYKDEMDLTELQPELEKIIYEGLIFRGWMQFNFESYKNRLVEIDKGFYQLLERVKYEPEKRKANKKGT